MKLNGYDVPLDVALPLRVGDWEELEAKGITLQTLRDDLAAARIKQAAELAIVVIKKTGSQVEVAKLNRKELMDIVGAAIDAENKLNPPISDSSTNSPAPTAGVGGN